MKSSYRIKKIIWKCRKKVCGRGRICPD